MKPATKTATARPLSAAAAAKARTLFGEGIARHQAGALAEAQALYRQLLKLVPGQADALHMLGVSEFQLGRPAEAARLIAQAIAVAPRNALAHFNHGNALQAQGRLDDARRAFERALQLEPGNADALMNLANVLKEQNDIASALAVYDSLLALQPGHAYATYNKAIALLMQHRYPEAWPLYESRRRCDDKAHRIGTAQPRIAPDWDGQPLAGPLLVLHEQGLGDQVFYAGMLAELIAEGIAVILCVESRLLPLFRRSFPQLTCIARADLAQLGSMLPQPAAQILIGSLGRRYRSERAALSRVRSPYLLADPQHTSALRQQLAAGDRLLCGLSWSSQRSASAAAKSLPLAALAPVLQVASVAKIDFIDLQYGDTRDERQAVQQATGTAIRHLDDIDNLQDIDGLAALISACDLVVTVSNTTAHLAAALGKPVIVLLPWHTPLWYWHLDDDTSPWYPSARLLRQARPGDWTAAINAAAEMLANASASITASATATAAAPA